MSKKLMFLLLLLALAAGLAGGLLGSQAAQAKARAKKVLRAQEFRIVDARGVTRASLNLTAKGNLLVAMHDAKGRPEESLVVTPQVIKTSKKTAATIKKMEKMFSRFFPVQ